MWWATLRNASTPAERTVTVKFYFIPHQYYREWSRAESDLTSDLQIRSNAGVEIQADPPTSCSRCSSHTTKEPVVIAEN